MMFITQRKRGGDRVGADVREWMGTLLSVLNFSVILKFLLKIKSINFLKIN